MKETRVIELQDLKIVLNLIKKLMDMKPKWNESIMNLYSRLYENYYFDNRIFPLENNDDFVNFDGSVEHDSLDELIWGLGMNLPSWDDEDNEFKNKE
jgi:hypothetical protein